MKAERFTFGINFKINYIGCHKTFMIFLSRIYINLLTWLASVFLISRIQHRNDLTQTVQKQLPV